MCLFVHHACLGHNGDENGEKKVRNKGPFRKDTYNKTGD